MQDWNVNGRISGDGLIGDRGEENRLGPTCGHGSANVDWRQSCRICSEFWSGCWNGSSERKRFVLGPSARSRMGNMHGAEKKQCYLVADNKARGIVDKQGQIRTLPGRHGGEEGGDTAH